jgi:group I intron endonuclease
MPSLCNTDARNFNKTIICMSEIFVFIGVVYRITNKINNKGYIGQTVRTVAKRWNAHCRGKNGCSALFSAIKKYGKENFEIKVLARCDNLDQMNHREIYYIKLFRTLAPNGYNIMKGGHNSPQSEETKLRISSAKKGHSDTPRLDITGEKFGRLTAICFAYKIYKNHQITLFWKCVCDCEKIVFVSVGRLRSGNTKSCGCYNIDQIILRNKQLKGRTGKPLSDEAKQKLSETRMGEKNPFYGKKHTDEWKINKSKSMVKYYELRKSGLL